MVTGQVKLVASLLVRDELGRYLERCVGHLLEFCDEIRVVDDGSTDGTGEWLMLNSGKRVTCERSPGSTFFVHEGQARNQLLDWTLAAEPTHVLAIDADEFVSDGAALRAACGTGAATFGLPMLEVWEAYGDGLCVRVDGGWRPHPVHALWRVPARMGGRWRIADRQLACGRVPAEIDRLRANPISVDILHFGWANEPARVARHQRYAAADGGRFHRSQHLDSILYGCDRVQLEHVGWPTSLEPHKPALLTVANAA